MFGRHTASQIASASLPSFFPLLRYGATKREAMILTVWPSAWKRRAQSCAPEHASVPIRHAGHWATIDTSLARLTVFRITTAPFSSTPCTLNTFFARSIPTVVILLMTSPPERLLSETQSWHLVPSQAGEVPFIRWTAVT